MEIKEKNGDIWQKLMNCVAHFEKPVKNGQQFFM